MISPRDVKILDGMASVCFFALAAVIFMVIITWLMDRIDDIADDISDLTRWLYRRAIGRYR